LELQDKVRRIMDEVVRLSRAGFDRGAREILREFGAAWAGTGGCHAPASSGSGP
jgi:hypothetical protein